MTMREHTFSRMYIPSYKMKKQVKTTWGIGNLRREHIFFVNILFNFMNQKSCISYICCHSQMFFKLITPFYDRLFKPNSCFCEQSVAKNLSGNIYPMDVKLEKIQIKMHCPRSLWILTANVILSPRSYVRKRVRWGAPCTLPKNYVLSIAELNCLQDRVDSLGII